MLSFLCLFVLSLFVVPCANTDPNKAQRGVHRRLLLKQCSGFIFVTMENLLQLCEFMSNQFRVIGSCWLDNAISLFFKAIFLKCTTFSPKIRFPPLKSTHCCLAHKAMLSNYFCTRQLLKMHFFFKSVILLKILQNI